MSTWGDLSARRVKQRLEMHVVIGWNLNVPAEELGPVRKAEGRKFTSGRFLADRSSFNLWHLKGLAPPHVAVLVGRNNPPGRGSPRQIRQ